MRNFLPRRKKDFYRELVEQNLDVAESLSDILAFDEESQQRAQQKIRDDNQKFKSPDGQNVDKRKLKQEQEQGLRTLARVSVFAPAIFLGTRDLQDRFQYERIPALQAASRSSGEFSKVVGQALVKRENYVRQVTSTLNSSISTAIIGGSAVYQTYRTTRGAARFAKFASSMGSVNRTMRGLRMARRIAAGARVAGAATAGTGAGLVVLGLSFLAEAVITIFLNRAIEAGVRKFKSGQLNKIVGNEIASNILDAQKSRSYYEQVRGIPNFDLEELTNLRNQTLMYGSSMEEVLGSLRLVEFNTPTVPNRSNYTTQISNLSGFLSMNPNTIGEIFSNLAPIGASAGTSRKIQPVIDEFETFFVAVSQTVNPSLSQIQLVQQLSQFSRNYVYGRKMVTDLSALAQIQDFISRTDIGDKQSTAPTQSLITSIDNMLMGYVNSSNPNATIFAQRAGISRSDAVRGVTSDSNMLNNVLSTLQKTYNISDSASEEDKSRLMFYLTSPGRGLGLAPETALNVLQLVESYASGDRVSPVNAKNLDLNMLTQPENFSAVNNDGVITLTERRYLDTTVKALDILSESEANTFMLLENNLERLPEVIEITRKTTERFVMTLSDAVAKYVNLFSEFVRTLPEKYDLPSKTPTKTGHQPVRVPKPPVSVGGAATVSLPIPKPIVSSGGASVGLSVDPIVAGAAAAAGNLNQNYTLNSNALNIVRAIYGTRNVTNLHVTGVFGEYYRDFQKTHMGIDADFGDYSRLYSPIEGKVIDKGYQPNGYGHFIRIQDPLGLIHTFAHLDEESPLLIDTDIDADTFLGIQGNTGRSSGSHLHYDVRLNMNASSRINPTAYYEAVEEYEKQSGQNVLSDIYDDDAVQFVFDLQYVDANAEEFAQKFVDEYNSIYGDNGLR